MRLQILSFPSSAPVDPLPTHVLDTRSNQESLQKMLCLVSDVVSSLAKVLLDLSLCDSMMILLELQRQLGVSLQLHYLSQHDPNSDNLRAKDPGKTSLILLVIS